MRLASRFGYPYPAPVAASATEPVSLTHQTSFH